MNTPQLVENCINHTFAWFSDTRDCHHIYGEYVIERYVCTQCGTMKDILMRLDDV